MPVATRLRVPVNGPTSKKFHHFRYVTAVKNQGECGSCWTYGAIGPIEWAYKKATGTLLSFSEQELLDCTFEHEGSDDDGCDGGWYESAWDFVIANNHLPSEANYPYKGKDKSCSYKTHPNDLEGKIKITGYTQSAKTETAVLTDLVNQMPLAVAFTVEDDFYSIGDGIYDGCTETTYPNHAVVLTGYGSNYFEIKNSWGADWGLDGYARFERGRDICGLLSYAYYIEYKDLDDSDNGGDEGEEEKEEENEEENEDGDEEEATEENKERKECREPDDIMGLNYRGTKSSTKSGLTCQAWDSQSPNKHSRIFENYPGAGLKGNNYCRNPDHFEGGLWCFNSESTDPRWEICDVPVCGEEDSTEEEATEEEATEEEDTEESTEWSTEEAEDCLSEDDPQGINYRGTISITESGRECVDWNQQRYNRGSYRNYMNRGLEENYCRRPDQTSARPWCYISRGRNPRWEYCDIPKCENKDKDSSCKDEHESCVNWAHFDFCNDPNYEEFLSRTCRKSCNTCEEAAACSDTGEDCEFWAQQGFCNTGLHGDYMDIHCKKSCGRCDGSNVDYQTDAFTEWWDRKTDQQEDATKSPTEWWERKEDALTDWWDGDNDPTEKQENMTEEPKTEEPKQKTDPPCGGGLTRCPDGSCKHVHMCKYD